MNRYGIAWMLLGLAGLALPIGCGSESEGTEPGKCESDVQCDSGHYCAGGTCRSDCAAGAACASGRCDAQGRCTPLVSGTGAGTTANGTSGTSGGVTQPSYDGGIVDLSAEDLAELDAAACAGWKAEPEPQDALLMLVVDTSGSMNVAPDGGSGETKWEITEAALKSAIAELPPSTGVGMLFYPGRERVSESNAPRDPSTCVDFDEAIPMDLLGSAGSEHRTAIDSALTDIQPAGGTPTHDAYDYALAQLKETRLFGSKNMLLITDGQPTFSQNCVGSGLVSEPVEEEPIVEAVRGALQNDGIRSYVIGSPGSEMSWTGDDSNEPGEDTRPWLSRAAEVGGTASAGCSHSGEPYCHFDMSVQSSFAEGLRSALAQVSDSIVSCSYDLPTPPAGEALNPDAVNVVLTTSAGETKLLLRDDGANCSEGWRYADDGGVELCELSCDRVHADAGARLQLLFGCATLGEEPR